MSWNKPSKVLILLNLLALTGAAAAAIANMMADKTVPAIIWGCCTLVWIGTTLLNVHSYGLKCQQAAYDEMEQARRYWS